ncbi:HEAT repeat [Streptomyces sp. DvalAA-14]|uniref:HEAT repeat domain-containing protein n=1 Tax=unclassified Streptomyces TaxID=2593676 RepID=UPI00081B72CA|nr:MULTISPECIES: HEAT repeat domain-containing protein [unclassified Streptomyces]MYS18957.1 hypothetical protein [Streptomyces sp. SID4948]SCD32583.1 HEAT repeat [Streptomyces sp. DvalAA-14]
MEAGTEAGTVADLVGQALAAARAARDADEADEGDGADGDAYRTALWEAAADGAGALPVGLRLIGSHDPVERETGCDLLGLAADRNEAVRDGAAAALVVLAGRETETRVLRSLAVAIGTSYDQRAVPVLVALAGHGDAEVRRCVADSFTWVVGGLPDGPAVRALMGLTRDEDPEVRNWATFTLGFQAEVDSPAIRAALWARTTDENAEARAEGIRGLARRHDPRAAPLLAELLGDPDGAHVHTFGAAAILGAPELLPGLLEYATEDAGVTEALDSCDPVRRTRLDAAAWDLVCALHRLRPDLDAALSMERFGCGLTLALNASAGERGYSVGSLLKHADGDPARAAEQLAAELPRSSAPTV